MKEKFLRTGGVWLRVWLLAATVFLSAVLGHFDHGMQQAEFLGEAAIIGAFLALFLPWMFPGHARGLLIVLSAVVTGLALLIPVGASAVTAGLGHWEKTELSPEIVSREGLYAGQKVMILAAHPDDEVLMLGGVIEEYVSAGSEVTLVYATNGDRFGKGAVRLRETLSLADYYGIPQDNVVFLGFGDGWQTYRSPVQAADAEMLTSAAGNTSVSGLPEHPAYREGQTYTSENYKDSISALLREMRPDVIFCQDTDLQFEHRTLSFLFETALGELLRELPDYAPTVFKGFSYASSWTGESFIQGTVTAPDDHERMPDNVQYRTADAVRFPVSGSSVSPLSPELTALDRALEIYSSQDASLRSDRVMRSERQLFLRRTDSVLYDAVLTASSGDPTELTDVVVSFARESFEALSPEMAENGWFPDAADGSMTVTVTLPRPTPVRTVVFYDNPSSADNILSVTLTTDTGEVYFTDAVDPLGGATEIPLAGTTPISSFTLTAETWEGQHPGIAELEAFSDPAPAFPLCKLTDEQGHFAYKCLADGEIRLTVYARDTERTDWHFTSDNTVVTVSPEGKSVTVLCPVGESARILLTDDSGRVLDSVAVANPRGLVKRFLPHADTMAHLSARGQYRYYRSLWHMLDRRLHGYTV